VVQGVLVRHPPARALPAGLREVLGEPVQVEETREVTVLTVVWGRAHAPVGPLLGVLGAMLSCEGAPQLVRMRFGADGRYQRWAMAKDGNRRERQVGTYGLGGPGKLVVRYSEEVDTFPASGPPTHRKRDNQRLELAVGAKGAEIQIGPARCRRAPDEALPWGQQTPAGAPAAIPR
jgi:hypothetical protein